LSKGEEVCGVFLVARGEPSEVFDLCDGVSVGDAMAMPRDKRQQDLLRPALEPVIDLGHPLVRLGRRDRWEFLDRRLHHGAGQPPLPTRRVAGCWVCLGRMTYIPLFLVCNL
jgi:hypothetical protein